MASVNSEQESSTDEEFILLEEKELHGYNDEGIPPLEQDQLDTLKTWLNPTNYDSPGGELSKNQNYYTPHTGKWLPEAAEYKQLFSNPNTGLLWIKGIPGSGKSVIAARLVNELTLQTGVPVCYFFFREIMQRNRTQRSMVIDWLSQLIQVYPPCAKTLLELSEPYRSSEEVTTAILWKTFSDAAVAMRKIYIVVDALDEMDPTETNRCLTDLSALAMRKPSGIKIIATSRENPEIQNAFKGCHSLVSLRLDRDKIDSDIGWYAARRLEEAKDTISLDEQAREKLVKDLVVGANGLFLYAKLTMDEMLSSEGQLSQSEDKLPRGISDMYSHLLQKHRIASGTSLELQILVLQTVIFTTETLYLDMLSSILNLQHHGEKGLDMPLLNSAAIIRRICGPLLEIKDDVVHIVHHSFTEYLTNKDGVRGSSLGDFPVLRAVDAHKALCDICITLLNFDRFKEPGEDLRPSTSGCCVRGPDPESLARRDKYPFLRYALYHWGYHARKGEVDDKKMFEKMTSHLETEGNVFTQLRGDGLEPYPVKFTPLHIAAVYGIYAYVLHLLESGSDVDAVDDDGKTPLMSAAKGGNLDILELLLAHGAQLDKIENRKWTPLHFAAENGHVEVVRRLLELGVPPNPDGVKLRHMGLGYPTPDMFRKANGPPPHYSPIRLAIQHGHSEVVAELLPHLKPEDAIIKNSGVEKEKTILHYAASNDRAEIVLQILQSGLVDVNQQDKAGRTPLVRAIQEKGTLQTVKVLLQNGADPNLQGPLHACAAKIYFDTWSHQKESDIVEIAAALVDAGGDIDAKDKDGNTPIFHAAKGKSAILQWLIERGAGVNLRNAQRETPLHRATEAKTFESLIRSGVDINAQDKDGATALHRIHEDNYWWIRDLTLFMKYGANPYLEDSRGKSAFHASCGATAAKLDEMMEIPGIDINARDRRGRTILHWISLRTQDFNKITNIPEGVDVNAQDCDGNTAMHLTAHSGVMRTIMRAGANPHLKNRWGNLPFQTFLANPEINFDTYGHASTNDDTTASMNAVILKEILAPYDINMTDLAGNNALHINTAVGNQGRQRSRGMSGVIDVLVELGIDITAKNNEGKTALHLAAEHGVELRALLKYMGGVVNEVDAQGRTPLCYAASAGCVCRTGSSVQLLLDAGADASIRDHDGRSPLHFAAQSGGALSLYVLLRHIRQLSSSSSSIAIDIDLQDFEGHTPLHDAARTGHYATVLCLIDAGARVDIEDQQGMTPLHHAAAFVPTLKSADPLKIEELEPSQPEWLVDVEDYRTYCNCGVVIYQSQPNRIRDVIRLLLHKGADPEALSKKGYLPVHIAGESGAAQAIEALYEWAKTTRPGETTSDIVTWASEKAKSTSDDARPYPDSRYKLIKTAASIPQISPAVKAISNLTSPKEALWKALFEADETAVMDLLQRSDAEFEISPAKSEDVEVSKKNDRVPAFERQVVRYVIQHGWTSMLSAVTNRFGLEEHDILALAEAREPNLEMLRVLLKNPQIKNPDIRPKGRWGNSEGDGIIDRFAGSPLPWHTEAMRVLLEDGRANHCLKGDAEKARPPLLYTVLGWPYASSGLESWVNEMLNLVLACDGVDINGLWSDRTGKHTPLMVAARNMHTTTYLETLIKAGADVNLLNPVQACLGSRNPEALRILLGSGGRLPDDQHKLMAELFNIPNFTHSQKPVDRDIFKVLFSAGLDVNCPSRLQLESEDDDASSFYPSQAEVDDVESEAAKLIRGSHTGFAPFFTQRRPGGPREYAEQRQILHDIALYGSMPTVLEAILECPTVDLDARDASGRTPLLVACSSSESSDYYARNSSLMQAENVAIRLLDAGASPLAIDHAGYSAMDCYFATQKPSHTIRHWELFEMLLRHGGAKSPSRQPTLLLALKMRFKECDGFRCRLCPADYMRQLHVLWLLEHGFPAGPDVRDSEGNTAMHLFLPIYLTCKRASVMQAKENGDPILGQRILDSIKARGDLIDTNAILDKVFRELLERGNTGTGGDGNILLQRNHAGETPLYAALRMIQNFTPGVLATIVEAAGGPEAVKSVEPTKNGRTLLHALGERDMKGKTGRYELESWMRDYYHRNEPIVTRAEAYEYLVDIGIDAGSRDDEGLTAMELASMMGHNSLVEAVGMQ